MASNPYVNKVVKGNTTLIDLTGDDVTASDVLSGKIFHLPSGATSTGTCTYDANTSDANVTASEILTGKTAYKNGSKLTGTMPSIGAQTIGISSLSDVSISTGYHDGSGTAGLTSAEKAKFIAGNIKSGVTLLGVLGDYTGEGVSASPVTVTAGWTQTTVNPPSGYDYISEVTVNAISYSEIDNDAGGKTVTIGA